MFAQCNGEDRILLSQTVNLKKIIFRMGGHAKKSPSFSNKPGLCKSYDTEPVRVKTMWCDSARPFERRKQHRSRLTGDFFIDFSMKPQKSEKTQSGPYKLSIVARMTGNGL